MRTKVLTMSLLAMGLLAVFCLSGCKTEQDEENVVCCKTVPDDLITVTKLTKPEYRSFIIANYHEANDIYPVTSYMAYRANNYGEPVGKSGCSPYWELADDWLLVDWKWGLSFPYPGNEVLLINEPWEKLTHVMQEWPLETPHVDKPIERLNMVQISKLEEYCHKSYDRAIKELMIHPAFPDYPLPYPDSLINMIDSAWTILQTDLSHAISNGDIEQLLIPSIYYNFDR